jgi:RNA polymerase sigma-B factor
MTVSKPDEPEDLGSFEEFARTRDPALRDDLIAAHLNLAAQIARRFSNRGEPHDDLVQVASLALVKAVDRFDPTVGVKFSTFAVKYIVGELKRHFRDRGWAIRAPRRVQELYLELGHHIESLSHELGRPPTVAELARAVDRTEEEVLEATEAGRNYRASSLDAPSAGGETYATATSAHDQRYGTVEDRSVLTLALGKLAPRDRAIIRMRFIDEMTQSEIAACVGLSQMQVSRLLAASLERLRAIITEGGRLLEA